MEKKELCLVAKKIFQNKGNTGRYLMMELMPEIDPFVMEFMGANNEIVKESPCAHLTGMIDSFMKELSQYDTLKAVNVTINNSKDFLVHYNIYDSKNNVDNIMGFQVIDNSNILIDTPNHLFSLIINNDQYSIFEYVIDNERFVPKKRVRKNG